MFLLLLVLVFALASDRTRPPFFASLKMLDESPISGIVAVLRESTAFMGRLQNLPASIKESKNVVRDLGQSYQMVRLGDESGGYKWAIELAPGAEAQPGYYGLDKSNPVIS